MSALSNPSLDPKPQLTPAPQAVPPPPPAQKVDEPRRWPWILLGVLFIAGVLGWVWNRQQQAQRQQAAAVAAVKTARVTTGPLVQTMRVAGVTAARNFVSITAPIMRGPESGREMVLLYLVQSGSRVKKGQLLAQIDAKTIEDHIEDIGDDIQGADADIRKRKAEQQVDLENLNQTIRTAKAEFDKATWDAKATEVRTEVERELLKLAVEETEARYKRVQNDVRQKQAGYAAEVRILEITRERHVRHRNRHLGDLNKFKMMSPMDGLAVVQQTWRGGEMATIQQGDQVTAGQLFMKVVSPEQMQIEGAVNQSESSSFRIGQKAEVRLDAFPGAKLPGHIYSVGALATGGWRSQYYIRTLPVKVAIDGADSRVIPDLSASADVEIGRIENAKLVPLGAVQSQSGKDYVFVRSATGVYEKRAVTLGERNNTHAAVTSGLEVGEEVTLDMPASQAPATVASL